MQNRSLYFFICMLGLFLPGLLKAAVQDSAVNQATDSVVNASSNILPEKPHVFVMDIKDVIDPRMSRYVELALEEADEAKADLILVHMDTYGGAVVDANKIVTSFLDYEKPVWVFIDKDAASAGALISIACDSIYMARGASIGAATVVVQTGEAAPDKYQSYMRSTMRSTAEATGRDPKIAEAMVDENIDLDSIAPAGTVLTLSTSEAIALNYCEGERSSLEDVLEKAGIKDYTMEHYELSVTEKIISFVLNPFISGILIMVIIGGIYFELQTPGVGFPIMASIAALILYLVPYYLNGLAANWEIIVFIVGVVLLALEFFVIPGFGVAGISGIVMVMGSLILMMLANDAFDFTFVKLDEIFKAVLAAVGGLVGGVFLLFFGSVKLADTNAFKRIALQETQDRNKGYTSNFKSESFVGRKGTAYTVLRPSGKVMIDGNIYDAYTRGNFIARGQEVIVVSEEGTSLKVKEKEQEPSVM